MGIAKHEQKNPSFWKEKRFKLEYKKKALKIPNYFFFGPNAWVLFA